MLLGIRTAPKEDLGCSSAELVYGAPLTVPGDFIPNSTSAKSSIGSHLRHLREQVRTLAPIPTSRHGVSPTNVPQCLQKTKFVFIRRDAIHTSLQRPYQGPFKVIQQVPKPSLLMSVASKRQS